MSTATSVPETYELEGDDALRTLRSTGWGQLAKDSFVRFRAADGTSHSRGLAFQVMLTLLPFVIAVVGLATAMNVDQLHQLLTQTVDRLAPGPAGQIFTQAIRQGAKSAARGGVWALLLGLVAALASATVAMGQIERGANRLYGVEQDRPTAEKYWNGFKLACTAGVLTVAAMMIIVGGTEMASAVGLSGAVKALWTLLRWPLSIAFVVVAFALLFRAADGFSHSRALAFQVMLTLLPFVIAVVGLATALQVDQLRQVLTQTVDRLAPGPAGQIFTTAIRQGAKSAARGGVFALLIGAAAAIVSATLAMGQIERGANRLYGVEQDRPTTQKYWNGFKLACTAGVLTVVAFMIIVSGDDLARGVGLSGVVKGLWTVLQWPLSIGFVVVAFALLFKAAPRRHQPSWSWLAVGSGMSVLLWFVFTGLLALYLDLSSGTFGRTYGPLTGIIAILLWTFLTSLAIYLGLAFAAQLEAVRAGVPQPRTCEQANPTGGRRSRPAWR